MAQARRSCLEGSAYVKCPRLNARLWENAMSTSKELRILPMPVLAVKREHLKRETRKRLTGVQMMAAAMVMTTLAKLEKEKTIFMIQIWCVSCVRDIDSMSFHSARFKFDFFRMCHDLCAHYHSAYRALVYDFEHSFLLAEGIRVCCIQ